MLVDPVPEQPSPQSTSTTASLEPAVPRESSSSAPDSLRVAHPPPETVHSALPLVADSGPVALSAPTLRPASVLLLAEPVHFAPQSTSASATTSSVESESPTSTELEVPHPPAPSQCAVLLPCLRLWLVSPVSVLASRAAGRSLPEPVLSLRQAPPPDSHSALAPSRSARLD